MSMDPAPRVVLLGWRVVGSCGLLSSSTPFSSIILASPASPTGWIGLLPTPCELGDLWNVPLLLQDWFVRNNTSDFLPSFITTCPGKILHVGATAVLEFYVAGGGVRRADRLSGGHKRQRHANVGGTPPLTERWMLLCKPLERLPKNAVWEAWPNDCWTHQMGKKERKF